MSAARWELGALVLLLAGGAVPGHGSIDSRADVIVRRMSDHVSSLPSFRVDAETNDQRVTAGGQKIDVSDTSHLSVRRPDRLRNDSHGPLGAVIFRYDGTRLSLYQTRRHYYALAPAPPTLDGAIGAARGLYGIDVPAAELLMADPYLALMDGVDTGRYLGLETINGVRCHHLAFRGSAADWQLWVEDAARPLPVRYRVDRIDQRGQHQHTVTLSRWQPNAALSDEEFTFAPPPGAQLIELFPRAQTGDAP